MHSTILTISNIYKSYSEYNLVKKSPPVFLPWVGRACITPEVPLSHT